MNPQSFKIRLSEVPVQLPKVVDCQHNAEEVDQDPDGIQYIVSVGSLEHGVVCLIIVCILLPEPMDKMAHP